MRFAYENTTLGSFYKVTCILFLMFLTVAGICGSLLDFPDIKELMFAMHSKKQQVLMYLLQSLTVLHGAHTSASSSCKAALGFPGWPDVSAWAALNESVSGHLLKPSPPGAVCHQKEAAYSATVCPEVQEAWSTIFFHQNNSISSAWNNFNNDSCLPYPGTPCSTEGYPLYVVNATTNEHVQKAVDFARKTNVRLIVKGTGHDYLGRSIAPNSLSVWTHHMKGIKFHEPFKPQGCGFAIDTPAFTLAAGSQMEEINLAASSKNLTVLSGGGSTVGVGGYLTGGGHAALSATYGLAADHVLEIEVVTPDGSILTVNECQHQDLFWAMRGGGGSTFGVITSVTIKAFPLTPLVSLGVLAGTAPNTDTYWNAIAYILSQFPSLADQGITCYSYILPNTTYDGAQYGGWTAVFLLPVLSHLNSSASLTAALAPIADHINGTYPGQFVLAFNATVWPSFQAWWNENNGPNNAGDDILVGSRLLDKQALTANVTQLREAIKAATPVNTGSQAYLISGKGVRDVVPRGGSDAVLPAWRTSLVHFVTGVSWTALNKAEKLKQQNLLTNTYVEALRELAPHTGAYLNEADPNEPNFQETFWGTHYARLLNIKRTVDPGDVLWCTPCVGNERWKEVGTRLCRV